MQKHKKYSKLKKKTSRKGGRMLPWGSEALLVALPLGCLYLLKELHGVLGGEGGRGWWAGPPVVVAGHRDAVHCTPRVVVALQGVAVKDTETCVTQRIRALGDGAGVTLSARPLLAAPGGDVALAIEPHLNLLHESCVFLFAEAGTKEVKKSNGEWEPQCAEDRRGTVTQDSRHQRC